MTGYTIEVLKMKTEYMTDGMMMTMMTMMTGMTRHLIIKANTI